MCSSSHISYFASHVLIWQSTLSKVDTLGTNATVHFREVSALERVQVTRYPNIQIETWASVQCTMTTWRTGCVSFSLPTEPNTAHMNWYILLKPEMYLSSDCAIFRSVINLCKHPVSILRAFRTKILKRVSAVWLREMSALERVQLQTRYKCILAGTKFAVRFREVSGLESVRLERVDCIAKLTPACY